MRSTSTRRHEDDIQRERPPIQGRAGLAIGSPRHVGAALGHRARLAHHCATRSRGCGCPHANRSSLLTSLYRRRGAPQHRSSPRRLAATLAQLQPAEAGRAEAHASPYQPSPLTTASIGPAAKPRGASRADQLCGRRASPVASPRVGERRRHVYVVGQLHSPAHRLGKAQAHAREARRSR